jgi:hypothetical protein
VTLQGTLAITPRDRATGIAHYGRIGIPAEAAIRAGLTPGCRIDAVCTGGIITITANDNGRVLFPPSRTKARRHAFEQSTNSLNLPAIALPETLIDIKVFGSTIRMVVPKPPVARIIPEPTDYRGIPTLHGTAKTLSIEAARRGEEVRSMTIPDIIDMLRDRGRSVVAQGPRAFKLDGQSACLADLLEAAVHVSRDRSIALIM